MSFQLKSRFKPTGDQPQAIAKLVKSINSQNPHQTLLGVTGSGKTFTIANLIEKTQRPALIISHNKTLAAQLYQEFRDFFPKNAVSYFVSYYDYYQPEAYLPSTNTYIEKTTDVNDEIDKLRLSATTNLLTRPDVIVVASVSCIYNLGSPIEYGQYILEIIEGQIIDKKTLLAQLVNMQYQRNNLSLTRGVFQLKGDIILIYPAYADYLIKLEMLDNQIQKISRVDPLSLSPITKAMPSSPARETIYPAKHYLTNPLTQTQALKQINKDLQAQIKHFKDKNLPIEAYRIKQKVENDLDMIKQLGYVNGIENYSRYFDGRNPGQPPFTLIDYFHQNTKRFKTPGFLTIVDESHITLPQIKGMFRGDQSRKKTLIDFGFRLPSALDNRPLTFDEWAKLIPQTVYTSATPGPLELTLSKSQLIEQLVRPTGLVDPQIDIRPTNNQIPDLLKEILKRKKLKQRTLVTTLTKKMAEDLTDFLNKAPVKNLKVQYLHADVHTLDRSDILDDLRKGVYDVLIGINLLREGLDLPEVSLVAILDADKEGFLRSTTSLIQTMGRASRHLNGQVIMYADQQTRSIKAAIKEVNRRRLIQLKYNQLHHLNPKSIHKPIRKTLINRRPSDPVVDHLINLKPDSLTPSDKLKLIKLLNQQMHQAAKELNFEQAAKLRDSIVKLKQK